MRLASYKTPEGPTVGVKTPQGFVDITEIDPALPRDMRALLSLGLPSDLQERATAMVAQARQVEPEDLLPVVTNPGKILCMGLNYSDHARESGMEIPTYPVVFMRTATSLLAPGAPLRFSPLSEALDFEAELAVVIGREGTEISEEEALGYVAGYAVFNDLTYRDYQFRSPQWTMGKNFDDTGPLGPELVTPDEVPEGATGLSVRLTINGDVYQDGNTSEMIFPIAKTISELSAVMTLQPGDVIVTGTPAGVGMGREPAVYLKRGDVCEVEIEGIGTLRTPIV
ncbi:MAG: fumarylacetoacetate hydrolase family protein [Pelagimonas sp.]|uniref:fumarylacetoacetate hydrolase family protein n=1 Tax=Pelagimonas sp. TaxID=2073170 RepID=UPI003D6BF46F